MPSSALIRTLGSRCRRPCLGSSRICSIRSRPGRTSPSSTRPRASWSQCSRRTSCSSRSTSRPTCATRSLKCGSPPNNNRLSHHSPLMPAKAGIQLFLFCGPGSPLSRGRADICVDSLRSNPLRKRFMAESTAAAEQANYLAVRNDWLARHKEPILEPELPIIDPHHHLWDRPGWRYLLDDLLADINSGHKILATVFVQARAMLREGGPDAMRPLGEVEFVNGVAAMTASGIYGKI